MSKVNTSSASSGVWAESMGIPVEVKGWGKSRDSISLISLITGTTFIEEERASRPSMYREREKKMGEKGEKTGREGRGEMVR